MPTIEFLLQRLKCIDLIYPIKGLVIVALCAMGLIHSQVFAATSMDTVYEVRAGNDYVYVANPDHDSVTVIDADTGTRIREIAVGDDPRNLALDGLGFLWVTNKGSSTLSIISTSSLSVVNTLPGPTGSRPHGIVIDTNSNNAYVVLEDLGTVYQIDTISGALNNSQTVGNHPRTISINDTGSRIYLPRFITEPISGESGLNPANGQGEVVVLSGDNLSQVASIPIAFNQAVNGNDSNTNARGVPNYLMGLALSPNGTHAVVPAKIDNIHRGAMRDGLNRRFNVLTRGILATVNLGSNTEILNDRIEFPNNSQPTAVAYSPDGNLLYVVHEASRAFEVINTNTGNILYETSVEYAPTGLVVSPNGNRVYVHNWLSRTLTIFNTSLAGTGIVTLTNTVDLVSQEALSANVLLGKRLFHDSADPRLSGNRYISCSTCHSEGGDDGRVYDFSDVGEGLRSTTELRGRGNMEQGLVHWTANFDEIQDFEHAMREIFGGTGLMSNADFNATSTAIDPNGLKTGRSTSLDALAAFVDTLDDYGISPHRQANGQLTAQAQRGRQVFNNASCATCHSGTDFTNSPEGGSYNIGTVDDDTGGRFGQPLIAGGLDTPPLKGLWRSSPFLHDGDALTVRSAIEAHTDSMPVEVSSFSSAELDDLAAYLLQIDDSEPAPDAPIVNPGTPDTFSTFASISIDGQMTDWNTSSRLTNDRQDAIGGANQLDYQTVWMANDTDNLYLRYRNHEPYNTRITWGYGQAIDVDGPASGYRPAGNRSPIGVDYLIEERSIYRYTGNGNSWSWAWITFLPIELNGRNAELSVARTILGNPDTFNFFMYADNNAIGGNAVDFIPDSVTNTGASLEDRYMVYEFAGGAVTPTIPTPANNDPFVFSNPVASLTVDGSSVDWQGLEFFDADPNDIPGNANQIDFLQAGMAHNTNNFYFGWNNDGPTQITWGNGIFIDTDLNFLTGFRGFQNESPIGIDFLVEANSVYRYTGNGTSWQWQWVGNTFPVASASSLEIRVPLTLLDNPVTVDLFFYGDSSAIGGTGIDFYPDAVTQSGEPDTARRFRYTRDPALADSSPANLISQDLLQD